MNNEDQYNRQSFLGPRAQEIFETATVGVIGLGGGGSHIVQQLAHLGFQNYVIFDPQTIDKTNLNRLVGGRMNDVRRERTKICIATRTIKGIQPQANVRAFKSLWNEEIDAFRRCDLIFAGVDSYRARHEIETSARRFLIPMIDVGMDVYDLGAGIYSMSGQVIVSLPDYPCMTCMGFINESKLAQEARKYGDAGSVPQVVWANGVLASIAVGIGVDLLTNWTKSKTPSLYVTFDGNRNFVQPRPIETMIGLTCHHFRAEDVGDPIYKRI